MDSRIGTYEHILTVQRMMNKVITGLLERSNVHDQSKLVSPEVEAFDGLDNSLKGLEYGSPEYRATLKLIKPAIKHHYQANSHHPEYYQHGVAGMDLLDLVEMFCDWKAASLRHESGDFGKSIEINKERFGLSDDLARIFVNSVYVLEED